MAYTGAELATRVLRDLGLIAAEETPSAADLAWSQETCDCEIALLTSKSIKIWNGSEDSIPPEYLTTLSRRIGLSVAPSFGLTDIATATLAMAAAEHDLRVIGSTGPTGSVLQADYY